MQNALTGVQRTEVYLKALFQYTCTLKYHDQIKYCLVHLF